VHTLNKILFFLFFSTGLLGCALAPVTETPKDVSGAPEERFVRESIAKAKEFEAAGQLPEALSQYKIALAVRPNDRPAKEGRERIEKALRKGAEEHYRAGLRMQKEGKQAQAFQQFLAALRLRPDYPEALQMALARRPVPAEKQVVQKVQAEPDIKEPPQELSVEEEALASSEKAQVLKEQKEDVDQTAVYREYGMELYREGRYQEALFEFNKVLSARPDDPVAKDYSYRSSFELAVEFFQKKEYLAAKEQFLVSLKHNSKCQHCHVYIRRSEELFKEMHYKQGIEYYGKEQLADAIMEWELVRGLDPNYKRVDYYIKKAKDIQRKLDELKKESKEEGQE
jgi:tetratricopeptide (TPR) repeat protein